MKWGPLLGTSFIVLCMVLYQWPKIDKNLKREKFAFIFLTLLGWLLANALIFFPNLPGPTEMINGLYKPFGKLLE